MSDHVDDPTELDLVYNDLWNAKARIKALEAALRAMLDTFKPFRMKPVGAPNSQARLDQDHQIDVHNRALAALAREQDK